MKKLLQTVAAFMLAFAMVAAPVADAQTRGRGNNTNTSSGATAPNRPAQGNSGQHATRPATPQTRPSGNGTASNNNRPGNTQQRPGGTSQPQRPQQPTRPQQPQQPQQPMRPQQPQRPQNPQPPQRPMRPQQPQPVRPPMAHRPPVAPPRPIAPGFTHHVPFFGSFHRPVPPPRWRYAGVGPAFGTILGVALGTAIGTSINALVNSGYNVSNYGNDVVYLTNVPQMNFYWPDAALYYTNGVLTGSQFTDYSTFCDTSRYYSLYNAFVSQYGMPVQSSNSGGIMSSTWYGMDGRYVTISFNSNYTGGYYTTLSFGN